MSAARRKPKRPAEPPPVVEVAHLHWDRFAAELWERRVVHFKAGALPPFTDAHVFAAATAAAATASRRIYGHGARPPLQLTIERMQQSAVSEGAPRPADRTLSGYQTRMARLLAGRRYALIVTDLHSFAPELWTHERAFLDELWRRLGLPLSGAITTLFHGNYEHTPVGVHRDRFGTFLFLLRGRKRMRFWPHRPWTAQVSSMLDYQPFLESSFAVELAPGEALYWPSSYYHVGENLDAEPATSVNIGVPIAEHLPSYYVDDLAVGAIDEQDLSDELRARSRLAPVTGSPLVAPALDAANVLSAQLPTPLRDAIASVRQLAEPRAARRHLQRTWLCRVTASGLEPPPPPAKRRSLDAAHLLELAPHAALRWVRAHADRAAPRLFCGGNGHCLELDFTAELEALLRRLISGESHRVSDLLRPFPTKSRALAKNAPLPATRQGIRRFLEELVALRVLH